MTGLQIISLLFLSTVLGVYCRPLAPLVGDDRSTEVIEGEYIVVLHSDLSAEEVNAHIEYVREQALMEQQLIDDVYSEDDEATAIPEYDVNSEQDEATAIPEYDVNSEQDEATAIPEYDVNSEQDEATAIPEYDVNSEQDEATAIPEYDVNSEQDEDPKATAIPEDKKRVLLRVSGKHKRNSMPEAVIRTYNEDQFKAYAARLSDSLRDGIRSLKEVKYIERNQVVKADACFTQYNAPWGLARTVSRARPIANTYKWAAADTGAGVDVYVIDTGINTTHPDFEGRAKWGKDFTQSIRLNTDVHGHGTHVAGTIMSKTYGVAKKATAIAVRVLGDNGSGTLTQVLDGIVYVINQHTSLKKSIINLSLGMGVSNAVNTVVNTAAQKGIYVVSAAGNERQNACLRSPGSANYSITVMASDSTGSFASFSNYGPCAHIIAPGVDVLSTTNTLQSGYKSGTSMAAPHVAGVIAKYIGARALKSLPSPVSMRARLQNTATPNIVKGVPAQSPNKLLYYTCN